MFDNKEVEEELLKLFKKIKDKEVVVEGKRDKEALYSFGFTKIRLLNKSLHEVAEKLEGKEVLILTDFDNEGKQLAKKLNQLLQPFCKVDMESRRKIGFIFTKLKIKTIEELRCLK